MMPKPQSQPFENTGRRKDMRLSPSAVSTMLTALQCATTSCAAAASLPNVPRSEAQRKEMQRLPSQFECYKSPRPSRDGPQRGPIERPRSYEVPGSRTPIRDFIPSVEGGPDGPHLLDQTDDLPTIEQIIEQQHNLLANRESIQQQPDRRRIQECIVVDLEDDDLYTSIDRLNQTPLPSMNVLVPGTPASRYLSSHTKLDVHDVPYS
jgi:hypothetical protein